MELGGCDDSSEDVVGWLAAMSGRGLWDTMEFGVDVTRVDWGGHSGKGGSCKGFSWGVVTGFGVLLGDAVISRSFSLLKPRLMRLNKAFILPEKEGIDRPE